MSSRSKSPRLEYYPSSLKSPDCGTNSCGGNGSVIAASIILVILIIFVVVGGIWYWSSPGCSQCGSSGWGGSCGCGSPKNTKVVRFADTFTGNKELRECSKELLNEIMSGKSSGPVVIAFVAPWCGFCSQMKPDLEAAARESNNQIYTLTQTEGADHVVAAAKHLDVKGFPAIFKIENGKAQVYSGDRSKNSIVEFSK